MQAAELISNTMFYFKISQQHLYLNFNNSSASWQTCWQVLPSHLPRLKLKIKTLHLQGFENFARFCVKESCRILNWHPSFNQKENLFGTWDYFQRKSLQYGP